MTTAAEIFEPIKREQTLHTAMRPIGDHIVVTTIEDDKKLKTLSGVELYLPDVVGDKPNRGVIVAVGEGRVLPDGSLRPINIKKGETVLFSKYAGNVFHLVDSTGARREYLSISYDDILVVLE